MKITNINDEKIKTLRVRSKFTFSFFSIVFPIIIVVIGLLSFLTINGIPFYKLSASASFTLFIAILCLVLGYVISLFLMNMVFRPLEEINKATKEVAKGNYSVRLNYDGSIEEIKNSIDNFNYMMEELNSVEIMRKDFIANVSHEFKTPLSSINGYITLLQDPELNEEERQEYMKLAFFYVEKLNDLATNILQISKLENQSTLPPAIEYRLDEQLREAIVLLESKWMEKNIELDLDLEEICYTGQQELLFHVWTNLISNAIKFSDQDGYLAIHLKKDENSGITCTVEDHGIGMDEQTLRHIFEKFYQGDSSRKAQGNGLGLALCKAIIERCGGQIHVKSEFKKGTVFTVNL